MPVALEANSSFCRALMEWIRPASGAEHSSSTPGMLARYSNDRLPGDAAPRHQSERRLAIRDPILSRTEPRLGHRMHPYSRRPDNPPHYEPTTYGAFSQHLLTLSFAHRRESSAAG